MFPKIIPDHFFPFLGISTFYDDINLKLKSRSLSLSLHFPSW